MKKRYVFVLIIGLLSACVYRNDPSLKIDGEQIYYISKQNDSINIEILNIETLEKEKFSIDSPPIEMNPSLPIWSEKLQAFLVVYSDNSNSDIYSFDKDGKNIKNLTNTKHVYETNPIPSPDGKWIAYERFEAKSDIWIMDKDGKNQKNLTLNLPQNHNPIWSINSAEIFFSSNKEGTPNIFKINLNGELTNISRGKGVDGTFSLSPDTRKIVFDSDRAGNMDIFLKDLETQEVTNLTNSITKESEPLFSPDGKLILFKIHSGVGFDYSVLNLETMSQSNISNDPSIYRGNAIWSRNSSKIFFSMKSDEQLDINSIEIMSNELTNLTKSVDFDEYTPILSNFSKE